MRIIEYSTTKSTESPCIKCSFALDKQKKHLVCRDCLRLLDIDQYPTKIDTNDNN